MQENSINLSLGITVRHHSASLVMPISDPRDRFFYPHHTPMKDTYNPKYSHTEQKTET